MPFSTHPLIPPREFLANYPITEDERQLIADSRDEIRRIVEGESTKKLLIIGPCSVHDHASTLDYAKMIVQLMNEAGDVFYPVMRAYVEKPRTSLGWKGMLYDPHLDGSNDILSGLISSRRLFLSLLKMRIPLAMEFLDPLTPNYLGDLISWACIGARTSASQIHRQMASALSIPVGFKNSIDGNVQVAIGGVMAARLPQTFMGIDGMGKASIVSSSGNPYGHIVLRGSEEGPNYYPENVEEALGLLRQNGLKGSLVIDCSHDNSGKDHEYQPVVFQSVVDQITRGCEGIIGLAVESHLKGGAQQKGLDGSELKYGLSLTDACLDAESTFNMVLRGAQKLRAPMLAPCYAE